MRKAIVEEKKIDEFLWRGVAEIYPTKKELKKRMMSGKPMKVYCGFDPSAPSLHIGNAILLEKLSQLQKLGHQVIFLIGDFTGMIGDPTDKSATRKKLTRDQVLKNAKNYQKQASAYLDFNRDNPAKVCYNSEWSDKLTFRDLIEISSNFTVQQMIQRDMFQKRIEEAKPIHLHEFLYPLAQGYDSVAMDVDLEIGGNDQMFNMLCGRDLMKAISGKEKFVLTMKLLADDQGKKMGKSEGNVVWLEDSPANMYGKVMAWPDGVILAAFEMCTRVNKEELQMIQEQLQDPKVNPRDLKMKLAFEITKINYGKEKALKAQDDFIKTFQKKELPDRIEKIKVSIGEKLVDFLVFNGLATSKSDAKRKVDQGGVKIEGEAVKDVNLVLNKQHQNKIIKVGKKIFRKIAME